MCTGVPLFRGRNELEQLTLITNVLGEPPLSMLIVYIIDYALFFIEWKKSRRFLFTYSNS